jgi:CSLREA domain-containing protein
VVVFWACFVLLPVQRAGAVTITVDTVDDEILDDGDCSLREALRAANTNLAIDACPAGSDAATDEIVVPAGTYTLAGAANEDDGLSGDLDVLANTAALDLIVSGAGAAVTIVQPCTVSQKLAPCPAGQGSADRAFNVLGAAATFRHLTMRHGSAATGGAVYGTATPGLLTFEDCIVTDNHVGGDGGAIRSFFDVTVIDSTISDNSAQTRGGGIFNEVAVLDVRGSTFSGNFAVNAGGAIINSSDATATIVNSTISGNSTGVNGGGIFSFNALTLRNCTITGNTASTVIDGQGGGLYSVTAATVENSIIAGNVDVRASGKVPDCFGTVTSQAYNLVGDGTSCTGITHGANGSQVGTQAAPIDARLGALADNGGPTPTHEPEPDSPAVGGGSPALPGGLPPACAVTDQRGVARPQGAVCDIGAVETTDTPAVLTLTSMQPNTGGNVGTVSAVLHGDAFESGATVRLTRAGAADVVGIGPAVAGTGALLATFDLAGAAPGAWNVVVTNPDMTTATLADGFTVEAGGEPVLWADVLTRRQIRRGRLSTIYLAYGNRGNVDAIGVPIWISFPDEFLFALRFLVAPPPVHAGQPATDWNLVGITTRATDGAERRSLPFLLPIVPAGFSGVLELRLRVPVTFAFGPFRLAFDIGPPIYGPDLSAALLASFVTEAQQRATAVLHATTLPDDATVAAYVGDQLDAIRTVGPAAWRSDLGHPPVYSMTHLLIDASQFAAVAGGNAIVTASASPEPIAGPFATLRDWLAGALLGAPAQARLICADCFSPPFYGECPEPDCVGYPEEGECEPEDFPPCSQAAPFAPCNPDPVDPEPEVVDSSDPNDKIGPSGVQGYIDGVAPLPYAVFFENVATATAPAQEVVITDQLDVATLDLATFALGPIGFGDTLVVPPPGLQSFATDVDLRPDDDLILRIEADLALGTGIVTWRFTSLDPATGELTEDPLAGFLPPNVTPPEGDGSVLFTISPQAGLALGTSICNEARIVFDLNPFIDTPAWCNTIGTPPYPEDCENCLDDDADGLTDRDDADCAAPADGGGAGVAPEAVKSLAKCDKALRKVGTKLATTRLAAAGKCLKAAADCVQLKASDAKCVTGATAKCAKLLTSASAAAEKLVAALGAQCQAAAGAVGPAAGLGFDDEAEACAARGVGSVATLPDVLECLRRRQACAVDRLVDATVPRAAELLTLVGRDPVTELPCLASDAASAGAVGAALRKPLRKCDTALQKAAAKLLARRTAGAQRCGAAVFACIQQKPGNAVCFAKASKACTTGAGKTAALDASFASAVIKACGAPLTIDDLLAADGLHAGTLANPCSRFGVPTLGTPAALATCLGRQVACRAQQIAESATPRLHELLDLGGVGP